MIKYLILFCLIPTLAYGGTMEKTIVKVAPNHVEIRWQEEVVDGFGVKKLVNKSIGGGEQWIKESIATDTANLSKWNSKEYQTTHLAELTTRKVELDGVVKPKQAEESDKDYEQRIKRLSDEIQRHTDDIAIYSDDVKYKVLKEQMVKKYEDKLAELEEAKTELIK